MKTSKAKSSKLYKTARLQSAMVFGLDDEPIPGVDAPSSASQGGLSIALNPLARVVANERKREGSAVVEEVSKDFLLLANSFRDSTKELAQALMLSNAPSTSATATPEPSSTLSRAGTEERISIAIQALDKKIASMEARLTEV